jgi:hypothetical protein
MNNTKIVEQINKLTEKTAEKKIIWTSIGQNLFRWVQFNGKDRTKIFTATIQMQSRPSISGLQNASYFLTIQMTNPNTILLQVNTITEPDFKDCLGKLYSKISDVSKDLTAETLNNLIDNL